MASLPITISRNRTEHKFILQIDAKRFERLADLFGFYNPDFLHSVAKAERDMRAGRVRKIHSLADLD